MSDAELTAIRRKKYMALQRKIATNQETTETISANEVLNKVFRGRAWEVFNSASDQFPDAMSKVKELLVKLAASGEIKEVTGEELYLSLADLGLKIRLETKIEFASHGEVKSLQDRLKEKFHRA
jgi:DNA-binding TFAR19-related protein (PDSD5 family)